jgi:hypothetical protein
MNSRALTQAIGLVVVATLVASVAAHAGDTTKPVPAAAASQSVMFQGVQVAIDPATGRVRAPTAAEREALSKAMLQPSAVRTKAGAVARPQTRADALKTLKRSRTGKYAASMQVPESMMSGLVAERRADGSISVHHDDQAPVSTLPRAQEVVR